MNPLAHQINLDRTKQINANPKLISKSFSDFDFSDFEFTISSNLQTITRLLNCLRFNEESLPVGLVEVCCSNFENIFETILAATSEVYSLNKFTSIAVAVSILYLSRKLMNLKKIWPKELITLTGLSETDIQGCIDHIFSNPILYRLIVNMKNHLESEELELVYGNRKVIYFKNILKMYRNKTKKVILDFRKFEMILKVDLLVKSLSENPNEVNLVNSFKDCDQNTVSPSECVLKKESDHANTFSYLNHNKENRQL